MIFVYGLDTPEGPVLLPDGIWALVERPVAGGRITQISAEGRVMGVLARTERSNGLALDRRGVLWVADTFRIQGDARLLGVDNGSNTSVQDYKSDHL